MSIAQQVNLSLMWSSDGVKINPSSNKYKQGWIEELPPYETFNYLLYGMDSNILYRATQPEYEWQANISYNYDAKVRKGDRTYQSLKGFDSLFGVGAAIIENNINLEPEVDKLQQFGAWTEGTNFGRITKYIQPIPTVSVGGYEDVPLSPGLGVVIGDIVNQQSDNLWHSNQATISNKSAVIGLYTTNPNYENWILGNVEGKLVVAEVGQLTVTPNNEDISLDSTSSTVTVHELLHTGNIPSVSGEVLPLPDTLVKRDPNGRIAANVFNTSALTIQNNPTHVMCTSALGYDQDILPYPISALNVGDTTPIGTIVALAGSAIPAGWLHCQGSSLQQTLYPQLFSLIGLAYGPTAVGFFRIPDLRGRFIRGFDDGAGRDSGRVFGSSQEDAYRDHKHNYTTVAILVSGVLGPTPFYVTHPNTETGTDQYQHDTDLSGGDGIGKSGNDYGQHINETRPKNVAMRYIIKVD